MILKQGRSQNLKQGPQNFMKFSLKIVIRENNVIEEN